MAATAFEAELAHEGIRPILGSTPRTIVIVGAGFCGTLLATHLLRSATAPLHISLIEQGPEFGRGVAYARGEHRHLLNVPASRMSVDSRDRLQFVRFIKRRDPNASGSDFLPRECYGDYLQNLLQTAERQAPPHVNLLRVKGEVRRVSERSFDGRLRVEFADGGTMLADDVVLATGNPPPADLPGSASLRRHPAYVAAPWALPTERPWRNVLIVGTGLSMADIASQLLHESPASQPLKIRAISRRGLLPLEQADFRPALVPPRDFVAEELESLSALLRATRRRVDELRENGADWRELITNLRELAPSIWQRLSDGDRRQFLRHLQPFWDVHRHRLPRELAQRLNCAQAEGRLLVQAGRIQFIRADGNRIRILWRVRGGNAIRESLFDAVINASGPNYRLATNTSPLLRSLHDEGLISSDSTGIGLRTDATGALIGANHRPHPHLFYVGPMLRSKCWETTAVAELRVHVEHLARTLLADSRSLESIGSQQNLAGQLRNFTDLTAHPTVSA